MTTNEQQRCQSSIIPKMTKLSLINNGDWKIIVAAEYLPLLVEHKSGQLKAEVEAQLTIFLDGNFKDFRQQMDFGSVALLVGLFYGAQEIRIYSPRLGQELFWVQSIERIQSEVIKSKEELELWQEFKFHVEQVAAMNISEFPTVSEITTHYYNLIDFKNDSVVKWQKIFEQEKKMAGELLGKMHTHRSSLFERLSDWGLSLTAEYALLRIHMLKFLAILPSLDYDKKGVAVKRVLLEALRRLLDDSEKAKLTKRKGAERALPSKLFWVLKILFYLVQILGSTLLAILVRHSVRFMAKRFIAGESIEKAQNSLAALRETGRDATLDQLGELVVSEKEAELYCTEVLKLIRGLVLHIPRGEKNAAGIYRAHVSIKVSALCSDFKPEAFEATYELVAERLKKILLAAKEEQVFIHIDAEHYSYRDLVFKIYRQVLLSTAELKDFNQTGIVVQAYLRDAAWHLNEVISLAAERGHLMPIRLVKGAYWDAETVEADAHSFDPPEFINKEETDIHFRQLIFKIFQSSHLQLCLASHNFTDHCFAEVLRSELLDKRQLVHIPVIEHQCLHMTYEALSLAMAKMNWPIRNYVPVGGLLVGMAYLVRRIMENSSQVGVLTIMRSHHHVGELTPALEVHLTKKNEGAIKRDITQLSLTHRFFNIAPMRLYLKDHLSILKASYENFHETLKLQQSALAYPNKFLLNGEYQEISSSSNPKLLVGRIQFASKEDGVRAVELSYKSYGEGNWAYAAWEFRSLCLIKAANRLLVERASLAALISFEAGKSPYEALGDIDEAIDFLNFYAREESRLQTSTHLEKVDGKLISRGVIAVIAPWNFPLAIPCGMIAAALVCGNNVILKSAEQTPLIAQKLVDIFHESGVPLDALIHLPGLGEEVGQGLVDHEKIAGFVFTGSKNIGMMIAEKASQRLVKNPLYNEDYPCHVIAEMGGKNAIIVTSTAELDEAVSGILYSAFGHGGQKCSAASRIIVDNAIKDRLLARLKDALEDLKVGTAYDFATFVNPIISMEDRKRLCNAAIEAGHEAAKWQGKVWIDRSIIAGDSFCVGPVMIELPFERGLNSASFAQKELFGPILHVIGFDNLEQAIKLFNSTDYALTGGIFSQSQDDIDFLSKRLESGNIYINRSITGARVSIEPFGGFKLSGTGPKAGSKFYTPSFHHLKTHSSISMAETSEMTPDGEGSAYDFDLCLPSHLNTNFRLDRIYHGVDLVIQHFESLFQGLCSQEKEILMQYQKWIRKHFISFQTKEHGNRRIPGQLSFNDYYARKEKVILLALEARPHFSTLMNVLSALAIGSGLTVVTRNSLAYHWWNTLQGLFVQHGISKNQFDVFFATEEMMNLKLNDPGVEVVIYDGPKDRLAEFLPLLYPTGMKRTTQSMRELLYPFDTKQLEDFKGYALNFVNIRSFAINTMRHGAPMGLEL